MGYMGFGMQKWIYTMKPRKFLGKRNKPNGESQSSFAEHKIIDYYHIKPNRLENLRLIKYPFKYREKLRIQMKEEGSKQRIFSIISLIISLLVLISIIIYFSKTFELF